MPGQAWAILSMMCNLPDSDVHHHSPVSPTCPPRFDSSRGEKWPSKAKRVTMLIVYLTH